MCSIRKWEHERTLRAVEGGTEVTDRVTMEMRWPLSRIPGLQHLAAKTLALLFGHRHRRLARTFSASPERRMSRHQEFDRPVNDAHANSMAALGVGVGRWA